VTTVDLERRSRSEKNITHDSEGLDHDEFLKALIRLMPFNAALLDL
jgi:hypothetical protein